MSATASRDPAALVSSYVCDRLGLSLAGSRGAWVREAIARTGLVTSTAEEAVHRLEADADAFARLCDAVTVRESFFFRERNGLALVRERVLPKLRARAGRSVRVWSAGCAAGEEAYTLAMLLTQDGLAGRYRVLGTDLSAAAVAAAHRGVYGRWALRGLDDAALTRYFTAQPTGHRVRDEFRVGVDFCRHNLLDPTPPAAGAFDLVVCRNVLIYLTAPAAARVVRTLVAHLAPGGWLLVGSGDPLLDATEDLQTVRTEHGLAYRRRAGDASAARPARPARSGRSARAATREPDAGPPRWSCLPKFALSGQPLDEVADVAMLVAAGERALQAGQPQRAEPLARRALQLSPSQPGAHRLLVQALAQDHRLTESSRAAERASAALPLDPSLHHLHAVLLLESGAPAQAAAAARRAIYLDPTLANAHMVLARSRQLLGDAVAAERARRNGHRLLAGQGAA